MHFTEYFTRSLRMALLLIFFILPLSEAVGKCGSGASDLNGAYMKQYNYAGDVNR